METRNLPVTLTTEDLDQRRDKLAALVREHAEVEQEKKDATAAFSKRLKEIDRVIAQVAHEIREKAEYRGVPVTKQKNFRLGVEEIIRTDTYEVVDSRSLHPDERQVHLHDVIKDTADRVNAGELDGEGEAAASD